MRLRTPFFHSFLIFFLFASGCGDQGFDNSNPLQILETARSRMNDKAYRQAELLLVRALVAFETQGDMSRAAETAIDLGIIGLHHREYGQAIDHLSLALEYARKSNDFRTEMRVNMVLGDIYSEAGQFDQAVSRFRSVSTMANALNDAEARAETDGKIGLALYWAGHYEEARGAMERALTEYRASGKNQRLASTMWLVGEIYRKQKSFSEAINVFQQALESTQETPEEFLPIRIRIGLGRAHRESGNPNRALAEFREATNTLRVRKTGREYETLLLFEVGAVYFQSGSFAEARRFLTEAATIARSEGDRISENYLYLHILRCNEQLANTDQNAENAEKLARSYKQIAQRFAEIHHRGGEIQAAIKSGAMFERAGMFTNAREVYIEAVKRIEDSFGEFTSPEFHRPLMEHLDVEPRDGYRRLAGVLAQLRAPGEALAVLDKERSRIFFEVFQSEMTEVRHAQTKEDVSEARKRIRSIALLETELSGLLARRQPAPPANRLNALRTGITRGRAEVEKLADRVVSIHPNYEPLVKNGSSKLVELQGHIPRGALLIQFLPTAQQLYIFALSRTRFEMRSHPTSSEQLRSMIEEYMRLLHDPRVYAGSAGEKSIPVMTRFAELSTTLYDVTLRPIESLIERNLVIITSDDFKSFPFHALERQEPKGVKYLVEITNVDYLPSLSCLRYKTTAASNVHDIVAIGNPSGKNWSIDYELRDVRSFFKRAEIYVGIEASWEKLNAAKGDVLQIATEFNARRGLSRWGEMMLSDGKTMDQSTPMAFSLLARLSSIPVVFLSNQSGVSQGLTDLHSLLLRINGTSDVFINGWYADRKAAKLFSEYFYTYLSQGLAPGDSYRQALLQLIRIREVSHPRSWGQFFHYGVG